MTVLVIGRLTGAPDDVLDTLRRDVDPVIAPIAMRHGALSHWVAAHDGGVVYVDRWRSGEEFAAAMAHPEAQRAFAALRFESPPEVFEIVSVVP